MIVTNLYKMILNGVDLNSIGLYQEVMLCGGAYLCLFLDAMLIGVILFILLSIYVKIKTKKNIWYWLNLLIDEL